MIDTTALGQLTAELMEWIAEHYGDDFTVRTAAIVVEVDSDQKGDFLWRSTDDRPWVTGAFLHECVQMIDAHSDNARRSLEDGD